MNFDPLRDLWRSESQRTMPRLAEVVTLMLTCEAQADDSEMPAGQRGGWWADPTYGARLWVYAHGGRLTDATPEAIKEAVQDALQPLIDDGTVASIEVLTERAAVDDLRLEIRIRENDGTETPILYPSLWAALRGAS